MLFSLVMRHCNKRYFKATCYWHLPLLDTNMNIEITRQQVKRMKLDKNFVAAQQHSFNILECDMFEEGDI